MDRRLLFLLCLCAASLAAAKPTGLIAGKPTPPPPPPPAPVDPRDIYEPRPDLGGWLDTERNLLWGVYSITAAIGGSTYYDDAVAYAADYPGTLVKGAEKFYQEADYDWARGDAATDPDKAAFYYARAADKDAAGNELLATAAAAAQIEGGNTWRLPTKAEVADAINNRYFSYGDEGLNAFDVSPLPGLQVESGYKLYWTSTSDKGNRSQWAFNPETGTFVSVGKGSSILFALVVRNYTP